MSLRTKTLWFATQLAADVVDATLTALPTITVYAENSSRTFRSCLVWVSYEDVSTVTGATVGEHRVACSVNGAGATTITETDDISATGENMGGVLGPFDFTSHFTSNFPAAASASLALSVYFDTTTGTGSGVRNVSALIAMTYEYDDGAATQYATAIIPMESNTGALATSETEIGTNQIPQLTGSGGLLENVANVVVRQQFFLIEGNDENAGGTTGYTLSCRIDSGTTHNFSATIKALGSDVFHRRVHIESPTTSAVHAWKAWASGVASMNMAVHTMYVTYEFTISGTTEFLNSVLIPFAYPSPMGGTASTDASRVAIDFYIEEPTTITLKQSAYRLAWMPGAGAVASVLTRAGGQAMRTYTPNASVVCGGEMCQQRVDSGGAQGAGITVARGKNTFLIDAYRTDSTDLAWQPSGLLILNYKSGIASGGVGKHNHTTVWNVFDWDAALALARISASVAPNIPESDWYVNSFGFELLVWDPTANNAIELAAEVLAGDTDADGWHFIYAGGVLKDAEMGGHFIWIDAKEHFQRFASDPQARRLLLESARTYRLSSPLTNSKGAVALLTYHSITFAIAGNITGSAGGTVGIAAYRTDTGERVGVTSRSGNGAYSMTWYDDTIDISVAAREDATHVGASDIGKAT